MVVSYHLLPKLLKADKLDFNIGKPILTQINRIDECREGKGNSATRGSLRQRKDEKKKKHGVNLKQWGRESQLIFLK